MKFVPTDLEGAFLVQTEAMSDDRGSFTRTFCAREFAGYGLECNWVQHSISFNLAKGTLRGLHYQCAPYGEAKLINCIAGRIFDVIVDLRPESGTYRKSFCTELSSESGIQLYVPQGFAHGFLTLEKNCKVEYCISTYYEPSAVRGVRWNDPVLNIPWPARIRMISQRDANFPDLPQEP